ncbi:MAG: hypothetical protein ACHQHO_13865 [Solirubrobacterales bacterium]
MKQLKTLGLALIAVFALAAVAAASASAELGEVTPGLLFLKGVTFPITMTSSGGPAILETSAGTMQCETFTNEASFGNENENVPPHVVLVKGVKSDFLHCKEGTIACRSEAGGAKDPKETILMEVDKHFVALLNSAKELRPGVLLMIPGVVMLNCGGALIELRGAVPGEVSLKEGGEGITLLTVDLPIPTTTKCDTSDPLCKKLLEEKPFEWNLSGKFEPAELSAQADVHFSGMVKVDD